MPEKITWEQVGLPEVSMLSPAYKSNGHVFTSGCVGSDEKGFIPEDIRLQTELAIKNLSQTLVASGSSLNKVMKVLLFISNPADSAKVNEIYVKYFTNNPARSCVVVQFPNPKIKVELECIAST